MKKEMLEENKTSDDLVIYDLDKLDTDTSIDYETISENEDFILNNNKESLSDSSSKKQSSFIDKLLDINWHVILLVVLIFSVVFIIYRITNWAEKRMARKMRSASSVNRSLASPTHRITPFSISFSPSTASTRPVVSL